MFLKSIFRSPNVRLTKTMLGALTVIAALVFVFSSFGFATPKLEWTAHPPIHAKPGATISPMGFNPAEIRLAYGLNQLSNTGVGDTIAIVDAYGSPTIQNDLTVFSSTFGLPAANLVVVKQPGARQTNAGWALETSLDVEWVHAIAPAARILLVVAKSASLSDLLWAVDYATGQNPVAVSMSWGGSEFSSEASYDSHFVHSGTTYLASSGDSGAGVEWPAVSPNVVGVGGTSLYALSTGAYSRETAWSGSGGGVSAYEALPAWQSSAPNFSYARRAVPDIAFIADPNTGVAVYDTTKYQGQSGWYVVGGTSVGAPCWAGLIALTTSSGDSPLYTIAKYSTDYHDITSGSNGNPAGTGYDLVTGLGSPVANGLVKDLGGK